MLSVVPSNSHKLVQNFGFGTPYQTAGSVPAELPLEAHLTLLSIVSPPDYGNIPLRQRLYYGNIKRESMRTTCAHFS